MKLKIRKERFFIALTLLRIVLAFIVGVLILSERKYIHIAALFFVATALASFLEGLITRRLIKRGIIKSVLDFFADRILVDVAIVSLTLKSLLPLWVLLIFLARDFITIAIASILFYRDFRREFKPTALGKISLSFQIIALIPVILQKTDWVLIWIAIAITLASGIESLFKSEFRLRKKKKDFDDFRILRLIKFADVFTLTNVIFGIISILFALRGWFLKSSIMLILAVVADYLDGKFAKIMGQQNEFGKELDSLADTVSFGVAPAIFGFSLLNNSNPIAVLCITLFLFCGILRLARYNIMDLKGYFQGMPITLNGIVIPFVYIIGTYLHQIPLNIYPYIYLTLGILMISSFRIKRIT